ncbi:nucleotide-binding domain-containing protein [Clostridium vitabionis]|uniref:nucleotide-binding domain-containing protein n=1 Tax=Clostridium vitabionis TaxID=2784388 RepID=UPI001A9B2C1B|nr:nucleotidyltransferase [Clostridium vitabionis]
MANDFETFCNNIKQDNLSDMERTAGDIAKKLNKHYYDLDGDADSHMYIVGSVGRRTAIAGSSDLDILFDLPDSTYKQYDAYESNGQSALIQDVKNVLKEKYPNTDIRGDGQVVVIEFNKYTVELVPGFKQSDEKFKYPDTHDGGSWKYTDPLSEQVECDKCNSESNGIYNDFCHAIRSWKNTVGLEMGGLLIDTLVYDFFKDKDYFSESSSSDYLRILTDLYKYLKDQDPDRSFWYAVGSNQQVNNSDDGAFVAKAEKAHKKLDGTENDSDEINDILRELLGNDFPKAESESDEKASYESSSVRKTFSRGASTEKFIEELVPVDIRYSLQIDCKVTQNGWRPFLLRTLLRTPGSFLRHNKHLDFYITKTNCPRPYEIWWKVRNVGEEAVKRNMIRGQILQTNNSHQGESTNFYGPHFVECYLVKNGVCVARDKIEVPIGIN